MEQEVRQRMDMLGELFNLFGIPQDETTYQALVEWADYLRGKRNFTAHTPVIAPAELRKERASLN